MMTANNGTATAQAALWGVRARDWSELMEAAVSPVYEAVLRQAGLGPGLRLLDVGCGSGVFCQMASRLGADVTGLDATLPLLEIARERTPDGNFVQGEMEQLPFDQHSFDVVTGFNSFQYAADPIHALSEARRVARSGASVAIVIWGRQEDCELAGYLVALGKHLPAPPPGAPGPFALSAPGALRALAESAGLATGEERDIQCVYEFPDEATALRALLSSGPAVRAINAAGEASVGRSAAEAIKPYQISGGGYIIQNAFRYLAASA
jgi:SAM-dependent methyltransferase